MKVSNGLFLIAIVMMLSGIQVAQAGSGTWNVNADGNWSVAANWNPVAVPGGGNYDVVGLTKDITSNCVITIDTTSRWAGTLYIGDPVPPYFAYTLAASGGAAFVLNGGGAPQLIQTNAAPSNTISATIWLEGNLTVSNTSLLIMSGQILQSSTRGFAKIGPGTLVISSTNNDWRGFTTVDNGTLDLTTGALYYNLNWSSVGTQIRSGGKVIIKGWGDGDSNPGGFGQLGFGTATLYLDNGTIEYVGGVGSGNIDRGFTIGPNGATLIASGTGPFGITVVGGRTGYDIGTGNGGPLTLAGASSGYIQKPIGGLGKLVKTGNGTWTLSGNNTFSGGTTLSNGVLSIASDSNIGGASSIITFAGGTLQVTGTTLINLNSHTVNWTTFNGGLDIAAGNTFTVTNAISGTGSLVKSGSGTLALTGSNTYSGATIISNGTLRLPAALVTPTAVSALSYLAPRTPIHAIDGAGMLPSSSVVYGSTAGNTPDNAMWLSQTKLTWITFDLGSVKTLSGIRLWNYNETTSGLMTRGIKTAGVYIGSSLPADGASYGSMGGSWGTPVTNMTFAKADGTATFAGSDYLFAAPITAQYIQLYVTDNWGDSGWSGLSEIRFFSAATTNVLPPATAVTIASSGVLDLGGINQTIVDLAGSGTIINLAGGQTLTITGTNTFTGTIAGSGTQVVTGVISPMGPNVQGTNVMANSLILSGTLEVNVSADGSSDMLVTQGALDLTVAKLSVVDANRLDISKQYVVLTYSNAPTGSFSDSSLPPRWTTKRDVANKQILLRRAISGCVLSLQ